MEIVIAALVAAAVAVAVVMLVQRPRTVGAGAGARKCSSIDPPERALRWAQVHSSAKRSQFAGVSESWRPEGRFT